MILTLMASLFLRSLRAQKQVLQYPSHVNRSSKLPVRVQQNKTKESHNHAANAQRQGRQAPVSQTNERSSSRLKLKSFNSTSDVFPKLKLSTELN